jgi:hypothetical protein
VRDLRFEDSIYNVYITNQSKIPFTGGGGGGGG